MRISDWSSDVCSSDLHHEPAAQTVGHIECARQRFDALARHPSLDEGEAAVPLRSVLAQQVAALNRPLLRPLEGGRSEERRVGKECVSTVRSGWSPYL